jgi:hypothetical protein
MALGDEKLYFSIVNDGMAGNTLDNLLDPMGEILRDIAHGRRGAGRLQVTVLWPQIEKALDAGATVTMVWEALSKQGLVSIKLRGFSKEVKARRERARGPRSAADRPPGVEVAAARSETAEPGENRPGIPHRPWRTGPRKAPDPNLVFKPRDPPADD